MVGPVGVLVLADDAVLLLAALLLAELGVGEVEGAEGEGGKDLLGDELEGQEAKQLGSGRTQLVRPVFGALLLQVK